MSEIHDSSGREERARVSREALVGRSIAGRYVLRALVGHGGMGAVYEAEHIGLGKRVAIKFVDPEFATDERVVARFAREARAMSAIESAHIVTVFDAGTEDGRPYLVMELLRGEDLGQRLRRTRRVPLGESLHVIAQVLKGLAKAHAAGIVHRDLKPDNVFLVKSDTDPLFAKIVDFGISKIERPRNKTSPLALTGRGTVLGTPFYMSPEQAQAAADVDARADIYSVGAILFECLSGRPPHTGETYEQIILSICMRDAPDLRAIEPSIPTEVALFVNRALARDRTQRFGSAERMLGALHEIAPEEKRRVPLEISAAETLLSPGVLFPAQHRGPPSSGRGSGMETQIDGSARGEEPLPTEGRSSAQIAARPSPERALRPSDERGSSAVASVPSQRKRSASTLVATAIVATLTGVGAMLGIIGMLDRRPAGGASAPGSSLPPTITSAATGTTAPPPILPAPSGTGGVLATPSREVPPSSSAIASPANPASAKPTSKAAGAGAGAGGKPVPAKQLDIARDLP